MKKNMLIILVAILSILLAVHLLGYGVPKAAYLGRLFHLIISGDEVYAPQIVDEFRFWEKGFVKYYLLNPKYIDIYEIGFISDDGNIPSNYKYTGKLKIEIYHKNRLLFEYLATSYKAATYADRKLDFFKKVIFLNFDVPLRGKISKLNIKVTVLEPDSYLENFKNSVKLCIGVSSTP